MLDKILSINKYTFNFNTMNKKINIKVISDLHLCESFNNKKLDIIKERIFSSQTDYLFVCGDIIDSTNFLYKNDKLKETYINWFKDIAKSIPIYIVLGNHDHLYIKNKKHIVDYKNSFFDDLENISNVYISCKNKYYENDDFSLLMIEPDLKYYYVDGYKKELLIKELNKNKEYLNKKNDKLKILLIHSPINMLNKKVLSLTKNYDIILSGHMHGGIFPFNLGRVLPGNRGLISPDKKLFPKNVRGLVKISIDNKDQYLIVSGGITKLQECNKFFKNFNFLFPMEMESIEIDKQDDDYEL